MSLLSCLLDYKIERPQCLLDQHFGLELTTEDLLNVIIVPRVNNQYYRPWSHGAGFKDVGSSIKEDKYNFQVNLDVQQFSPEEITVKSADGYIVVEGKHEEKKDLHGYISRQFKRRYALPEGCTPETVESRFSSNGVLTVVASKEVLNRLEGAIPIAQIGPVHQQLKETTTGDKA